MPITFLRPGWFMENFRWDVVAARDSGIIMSLLQPLDKAFPMLATADIGREAAKLLQEPWTGLRVVELEVPRRVTPDEGRIPLLKCLVAACAWTLYRARHGSSYSDRRARRIPPPEFGCWMGSTTAGLSSRTAMPALEEEKSPSNPCCKR